MKERVLLAIILLVQSTHGGDMYFEKDSCSTLEPGDPGTHVPTNIMTVKFEPPTFTPGRPLILTISSTEGEFFSVFLRAVCDSCSHKYDRIGEFVRHDTKLKLIDCDGHNATAARTWTYAYRDLFTMKWVPDPDMTEHFHFEGSMMLNHTHWYSGYKSDTFSFIQSTTPSTSASGTLRIEAVLMCIAILAMILN